MPEETPETRDAKPAPEDPVAEEARAGARNKKVLAKIVTRLSDASKVARSHAAEVVHEVACMEAERLTPHVPALVDALSRPEPQTRWEILGALEEIARHSAKLLDDALVPATGSLHDPDSAVVRLAAFRMLSAYGSTSKRRAQRIWPLLDEALRCYHGDSEYPGMLASLGGFVEGRAGDEVKREAALLVEPDASHPKTSIARNARRVFSVATCGKIPQKRVPGGGKSQIAQEKAAGKKVLGKKRAPAEYRGARKKKPSKTPKRK